MKYQENWEDAIKMEQLTLDEVKIIMLVWD